jgi:tetratricopeptide (TPR) repeat protein
VASALLVEYFNQLPHAKEGEGSRKSAARYQAALETFKKQAGERYTEGTLLRLLEHPDARTRRAAVLALGMLGSMEANAVLAARLHDADEGVRRLASDALWSLWFRADSDANNQELQRILRLRDPKQALAGLDTLLKKAPAFAEAYNQRAILYFRLKEYPKSIADCERALKLNPYHFGALGGLAQCHMNLRRPRAALKAFRQAHQINPNLEGVEETIRALESALGEEGRKDDKK